MTKHSTWIHKCFEIHLPKGGRHIMSMTINKPLISLSSKCLMGSFTTLFHYLFIYFYLFYLSPGGLEDLSFPDQGLNLGSTSESEKPNH